MKMCHTCHTPKDEDEFSKNKCKKDGLQGICKECSKKRSKRYYRENRAKHRRAVAERNKRVKEEALVKLNAIKAERGCLLCPENDPVCLDFHHCRGKKEMVIAHAVLNSWKRIEAELKKCVVVCSNCHRKIHAGKKTLARTT